MFSFGKNMPEKCIKIIICHSGSLKNSNSILLWSIDFVYVSIFQEIDCYNFKSGYTLFSVHKERERINQKYFLYKDEKI